MGVYGKNEGAIGKRVKVKPSLGAAEPVCCDALMTTKTCINHWKMKIKWENLIAATQCDATQYRQCCERRTSRILIRVQQLKMWNKIYLLILRHQRDVATFGMAHKRHREVNTHTYETEIHCDGESEMAWTPNSWKWTFVQTVQCFGGAAVR